MTTIQVFEQRDGGPAAGMRAATGVITQIGKIFFFVLLLSTFYACSDGVNLEIKLQEMERLFADLDKNYKNLHDELEKYAYYNEISNGCSGTRKLTCIDIKLMYRRSEQEINKLMEEGPIGGLLWAAQTKIGINRYQKSDRQRKMEEGNVVEGNAIEDILRDETKRTQLNLCYNYAIKEQALYNILLNIHNAKEVIFSEIEMVKTDIKLKKLKDSQIIDRIDSVLKKYDRSNFEFHNVDANPNDYMLRDYWARHNK